MNYSSVSMEENCSKGLYRLRNIYFSYRNLATEHSTKQMRKAGTRQKLPKWWNGSFPFTTLLF